MSGGAYVGSFDAVRDFRAALVTFLHEAGEALDSHDLETRRTLDWLLGEQPARWQHEVRRCDEALTQAKIELERCRSSRLPGGEPPSCMEERMAVDRARTRRAYAEQKVEAVHKWGRVIDRETTEYAARANQLRSLVDVDLAGAIVMLDRILTALESYTALNSEQSRVAEPPFPFSTDGGNAARLSTTETTDPDQTSARSLPADGEPQSPGAASSERRVTETEPMEQADESR